MDSPSHGGAPAWPLPAPRSQADLFALLALYRPETGLDALIDRLPEQSLTPRLVYHIAHRRLPDTIETVLTGPDENPRARLKAAISSPEFRDNVVLNLLHAHSAPRRDILLRLPGQAPSPLLDHESPRRCVLRHRLGAGLDPAPLLAALSPIAATLPLAPDVLVDGTADLDRLIARAEIRPQDRLMLVIDTPEAAFIAQANQAVAQLRADPAGRAPESRHVRQCLGLPPLPDPPTDADLRRLAERALADPRLCPPNPICTTLGLGPTRTAEAALLAAAALDIEIIQAADHALWLLERWNLVAPDTQAPAWCLDADATRALNAGLLDTATAEDRIFHARVIAALAATGRSWVTGPEIARSPAAWGDRPSRADPIAATGEEAVQALADTIAVARAVGDLAGPWFGFGRNDASAGVRGAGWSVLEDHSSWTTDTTAELHLPLPDDPGDYRLLLDAAPFVLPGPLAHQRVGVRVNGRALAVCRVAERFLIDVAVPAAALQGAAGVQVSLHLPDATRPSDLGPAPDDRRLGLYLRSAALLRAVARTLPVPARPTPPDPALPELALAFESLGENCELGLVQRAWGAEPLGLLRFASAPFDKLLPALRQRFRGMGEAGTLEVQRGHGCEYMVSDRVYGFLYHAWAKVGELTPEQILAREHRRVPFLIRKLVEDLEQGEKIFVYHGLTPLQPQQARAMAQALRLYGKATLLWLELADAEHPPGAVAWVEANVIKGHLDRFAPGENAHDFSSDGWETVCRAAWRSKQEVLF